MSLEGGGRMSLRIEETFQLRAPIDRVWQYLVNPRKVVECLPGAELTEVKDDATYLGRVKVKVGPISASYNGKVTITTRDDAAHVVSMVGEGRESTGSGSAKMTMTSRLEVIAGGSTQVQVTADIDIVGKIVQFGRGMIESVNKQLFKQFVECVRVTLEASGTDVEAPVATAGGADAAEPAARSAPAPSPAAAVAPLRVLPFILHALAEGIARPVRQALARMGMGGGSGNPTERRRD
jgi:uncharacterized protein